MCMCEGMCMSWCARGGQRKMGGSQFFFLQRNVPRDHTQVARLGGRHPHFLSYLLVLPPSSYEDTIL